jgi:hypothetical protein
LFRGALGCCELADFLRCVLGEADVKSGGWTGGLWEILVFGFCSEFYGSVVDSWFLGGWVQVGLVFTCDFEGDFCAQNVVRLW